uniref:Helicase C-terminal domain-containing protein n=1 Tax=Pseudo-nitzschia australis TaxID=44445 RepID=A0A7S4A9N0_9STRA
MEQILDRFIDDARHKCEEAQRIAILHTNGMAGLTRLKVEARARGVKVDWNDRSLFLRSGQLYRESLILAQKNANPVRATAEAKLTGNAGFCSPGQVFQNGKCFPVWKMRQDFQKVWTTVEYESSSRRIAKLLVRPMLHLPAHASEENSNDFEWKLIKPTSVTLQVATAATGGEFVDCVEASLENDWVEVDNVCRTNKSKTWRIVVTSSDNFDNAVQVSSLKKCGYFVGLEVELYEPQINSDDLQLLHSLHNACLSYEAAIQIPSGESNDDIHAQLKSMKEEKAKIEHLQKEQAVALHKACMLKLDELTMKRKNKEHLLFSITSFSRPCNDINDCWDDGWYDDFLGMVSMYGSDTQQNVIFDRIVQDIEGLYNADDVMKFPNVNNISGLRTALNMRISKIRSDGLGKKQVLLPATTADNEFVQIRSARFKCSRDEHGLCMKSIHNLSSAPGLIEINENSHCRLCKADWNQTGQICRHCDIASILQDLKPDSITIAILTAIYAAIRTSAGISLLNSKEASHVAERAKRFFEVLEAEEREKIGAWRMWRIHLDLLNGLDELDSCKKGLRLSFENEDLTSYTEEQLNAIVQPIDVLHQYHDHAAKQAMSLGDLRQSIGTLRYLQNQKQSVETQEQASTSETCVVCLLPLDGECSVLRCGHRFHQKHCFGQILKISGGINVQCPMRCRLQTAKSEVMIATNKARDDGSSTTRKVKGSYGTKITRIVSDILCIKDKGEKVVIFSQWHDMLDILESALEGNNIAVSRPYGGKRFSESLLAFHSLDCTVLLLNLKQGAEGLTLVHATHVFMVEPVMNNGLDQQAINRIHRVGQTRQTFVWRYLIEDTIEMKLDKMRQTHQDNNEVLEDSMHSTKSNIIFSAGGIDGGFASQAELLEILDGK